MRSGSRESVEAAPFPNGLQQRSDCGRRAFGEGHFDQQPAMRCREQQRLRRGVKMQGRDRDHAVTDPFTLFQPTRP